jgi:hypothetical protein
VNSLQKLFGALAWALMAKRKPNYDPLPTELEQVVDEARADMGQGPAPRTARQGIADMQARIKYHERLIARLRKNNPTCTDSIAESQRQIREAKARLAEYQVQLDGAN